MTSDDLNQLSNSLSKITQDSNPNINPTELHEYTEKNQILIDSKDMNM